MSLPYMTFTAKRETIYLYYTLVVEYLLQYFDMQCQCRHVRAFYSVEYTVLYRPQLTATVQYEGTRTMYSTKYLLQILQ